MLSAAKEHILVAIDPNADIRLSGQEMMG